MKDYWSAIRLAESVAEHSRCNSVHFGCVLLDEDGKVVSTGYNDTIDPTCLAGICRKRRLGGEHGSDIFCRAVHAEQMAAGMAGARGRTAHTAVMSFSTMPCTMCLHTLKNVGVKVIVLKKPMGFYSYNDQLMWEREYGQIMEVVEYEQEVRTGSKERTVTKEQASDEEKAKDEKEEHHIPTLWTRG